MKFLKGTQIFILAIGIFDAIDIVRSFGGTIGCFGWSNAFYVRIFFFLFSSFVAFAIYKKEKTFKNLLIYVPLIYLFTFLLNVIAYRLQWFHIYEQWVGATKTWDTFVRPSSFCDRFFMRLFKYTGPYREVF